MRIQAETFDDAQRQSLEEILRTGACIGSSRGPNKEILGVQIELSDPRARLSRTESRGTLFSALGELLWYLAADDTIEFIRYYAPRYAKKVEVEDGRVVGAYGPRLFGHHGIDQVNQVIELLKARPSSKQAVIQLFDCSDLAAKKKDVPCTCTIQFLLRDSKLHAIASMRSNDAVVGMAHDVFAFTMLQEVIARTLGADLGLYRHWVASLHIYKENAETVAEYLTEGWQQTAGVAMNPMPEGNPWPDLNKLLEAERAFRVDGRDKPWPDTGSEYWNMLIWLLEIHRHLSRHDWPKAMASWEARPARSFDLFVSKRLERVREVPG